MWCFVSGWVFLCILKGCGTFLFGVKHSSSKMWPWRWQYHSSLKQGALPPTQHRIPDDLHSDLSFAELWRRRAATKGEGQAVGYNVRVEEEGCWHWAAGRGATSWGTMPYSFCTFEYFTVLQNGVYQIICDWLRVGCWWRYWDLRGRKDQETGENCNEELYDLYCSQKYYLGYKIKENEMGAAVATSNHCIGGWVGPRAIVDIMKKRT